MRSVVLVVFFSGLGFHNSLLHLHESLCNLGFGVLNCLFVVVVLDNFVNVNKGVSFMNEFMGKGDSTVDST